MVRQSLTGTAAAAPAAAPTAAAANSEQKRYALLVGNIKQV